MNDEPRSIDKLHQEVLILWGRYRDLIRDVLLLQGRAADLERDAQKTGQDIYELYQQTDARLDGEPPKQRQNQCKP